MPSELIKLKKVNHTVEGNSRKSNRRHIALGILCHQHAYKPICVHEIILGFASQLYQLINKEWSFYFYFLYGDGDVSNYQTDYFLQLSTI